MPYVYIPVSTPSISVPGPESGVPCGEPSVDEPRATSRSIPTATPSSEVGWETASSAMPQSGMTSGVFLGTNGSDGSTSSSGVPLASPSPSQESTSVSMTRGICGQPSGKAFASLDPASSSWRTCEVSSPRRREGGSSRRRDGSGKPPDPQPSGEYSQSFTRSGTMRNGMLFRRPPSVRLIVGSGFGLWPTPTANDNDNRRSRPTPAELAGRHGWSLRSALADATDPETPRRWPIEGHIPLTGHLNPDWVELLMGWPVGWTALEPLSGVMVGGETSPLSCPRSKTGPNGCESLATGGYRRWRCSLWHVWSREYETRLDTDGDIWMTESIDT